MSPFHLHMYTAVIYFMSRCQGLNNINNIYSLNNHTTGFFRLRNIYYLQHINVKYITNEKINATVEH